MFGKSVYICNLTLYFNSQTRNFISNEQMFLLKITIYWIDYSSETDNLKPNLSDSVNWFFVQRKENWFIHSIYFPVSLSQNKWF